MKSAIPQLESILYKEEDPMLLEKLFFALKNIGTLESRKVLNKVKFFKNPFIYRFVDES